MADATTSKLFEDSADYIGQEAGNAAANKIIVTLKDPTFQQDLATKLGNAAVDRFTSKYSPLIVASIFLGGALTGLLVGKFVLNRK